MTATITRALYLSSLFLTCILLITCSLYYKLTDKKNKKILFGTTPILNNKYWSNALKEIGIESETLMKTYYGSINNKSDYNLYFDDLVPKIFRQTPINKVVYPFFVWRYIIQHAKLFVMPFSGVVFHKYFWKFEYWLFKFNNIKTVVIPYGADAYMYSRIKDPSLQHAVLISYPDAATKEKEIEQRVFFWSKHADIVLVGFMGCDGLPRWDIPIFQPISIDTKEWKSKKDHNGYNGKNGIVKILHSPNHRGFKGTEYLLQAIEELKNEGLKIELILLEKVPNAKVKELMQTVDILAEQFIATGYALSGIEGMASGLPVLANLEHDACTTLFRRYSYLKECPVLSTSPETLKQNLRLLITNPELRKELGETGRRYIEKYHSYRTTQYIFSAILKKLDGDEIDLMNLFHPLKSQYTLPHITSPLYNNRYIP